jgi:PAS domain S-box-containing protein
VKAAPLSRRANARASRGAGADGPALASDARLASKSSRPVAPAASGGLAAAVDRRLAAASHRLQALSRVRGLRWLSNARLLMTAGLVGMVFSAYTVATSPLLGLVPDEARLRLDARVALVESMAAGSMGALAIGQDEAVGDLLAFVLQRNPSMRSAAVRRVDGELVAEAGPHATAWTQAGDAVHATPAELAVPLYSGGTRWGRLEVAFEPMPDGLAAQLADGHNRALLLILLSCFGGFWLYLGRMLKQLDPSRAVPDRVRNALDTLAEGLMLVDADGGVVLANAALAELLGRPAEEVAGRPAAEIGWLDANGRPLDAAALPWARALAERRTLKLQPVSLVTADGQRRSFLANCAPVGADENTPPAGVLVSLDDITELQRKEVQLREATDRAEQANRAKSDFLANMSHEIRTPMNAILGFTEMLRRGRVKDAIQARRHLDTVHANGAHLLSLINDILDLSKVEAGQLEVERIDCAPHRVIAEVVDALSVRAAEKRIGLRREVEGPVPATIQGDPSRLRQVITNLVGNAIKFTETGEVVVSERWIPARAGRPAALRIAVRDSGIGIPADKLGAIFEPFVQAESSTARRFGGTGLGLSISRKFARALGGDIVVESEPGRGSTFIVTIDPGSVDGVPMLEPAQAMADGAETEQASAASWRFPPRRLLVVDDSADNRELVSLVLQDCGLVVVQADSGQAALDAVAERLPDMILMDMQMPGMDGFTATRRLRAAGVRIPIYAFTAHALQGFDREIAQVGCDGYLTKPIDLDAMMATLAERLGGTRSDASAATAADAGTLLVGAVPPARGGAGEGPLASRLAGQARFAPVVASFAARLPGRLAALRAAFVRGDADACAEIAHWLKGSAGSVGYDAFTEPAREAENAARAGDLATVGTQLDRIDALAARVVVPPVPAQA